MGIQNVNKINQAGGTLARMNSAKVKRQYSAISMPRTIAGTGDMGTLIPVDWGELLPGQKITVDHDVAIQFMPFVSNLMHEIGGELLTFFVPYRLIWTGALNDLKLSENAVAFENFITGGKTGTDASTSPTDSYYAHRTGSGSSPIEVGTVGDYFGFPLAKENGVDWTSATNKGEFSTMLFSAYGKIWNDHIRLPDFEDERLGLSIGSALNRAKWSWDYFTRARRYQQRGVIPSIPVNEVGQELDHDIEIGQWINGTWTQKVGFATQQETIVGGNGNRSITIPNDKAGELSSTLGQMPDPSNRIRIMPHTLDALGINLNELMIGLGIMRVQVNDSHMEPRYTDHLRQRWGVVPEDARFQMSEFIGASDFKVMIDAVTQTSGTADGSTPQGTVTAQGWVKTTGQKFEIHAKEHGVFITLMTIRPAPVYEQGIPKLWRGNKTRFDFPMPETANLPDTEIRKNELAPKQNEQLFGWQGIFEEYRTRPNLVTGRLRPKAPQSLASYTLARSFSTVGLNKEFLECNPDKARVMQFPNQPTFIYHVRSNLKTAIPLPLQSEPAELGGLA